MVKNKLQGAIKTANDNKFNKKVDINDFEFEMKKIDPKLLIEFPNNRERFGQYDGKSFDQLKESIRISGVIENIVAREIGENQYQIITGHRRRKALIELEEKEAIVKVIKCSDLDAKLMWLSANLKNRDSLDSKTLRECITEEQEIIKEKIKRGELKGKVSTLIAQGLDYSDRQIERFLTLNNLIPEILELVDSGRLAQGKGEQLSHLSIEQQRLFYDVMKDQMEDMTVQELKNLRNSNQELKDKVKEYEEGMEELETKFKNANNDYLKLVEEFTEMQGNNSLSKEEAEKMQKELAEKEEELDKAKKAIEEKNKENVEKIRADIEAEVERKKQEEIEAQKKEIDELRNELNETKNKNEEEVNKKIDEIQKESKKKEEEIKKELEKLKKELEDKNKEDDVIRNLNNDLIAVLKSGKMTIENVFVQLDDVLNGIKDEQGEIRPECVEEFNNLVKLFEDFKRLDIKK